MAIWILLVGAVIYVISWVWLFSRVSEYTVSGGEGRQTAVYEEAV